MEVWQTDELGLYDRLGQHMRGSCGPAPTGHVPRRDDPSGTTPRTRPIRSETSCRMLGRHCYRAAHIHIKVRVQGEEWLTTQIFRPDSPYLHTDYVRGAVSDDLTMQLRPAADGDGSEATFDLVVTSPRGRQSHLRLANTWRCPGKELLAVYPDEHVVVTGDLAVSEREVGLGVDGGLERQAAERPPFGPPCSGGKRG